MNMDDTLREQESQEKTDYTYSHSISYRSQATPERRVGSPNMSRHPLRSPSKLSMSLRSRTVDRSYYGDSTDYSLQESSIASEKISRRKVNYGLDDSDSEHETFAENTLSTNSRHSRRVNVQRQNGSLSSGLVTKINGISKTTTYTADDDRPVKVFIRNAMKRFVQIFYHLFSLISTIVSSSFRIVKNPILTAAAFKSWSSHNRTADWQTTTTHVNTTSQTTIYYVKNYLSSVVRGCHKYYEAKKQRSPIFWWWIPLLMLILLPMFALWWQYGELLSESHVVLYSHMQSLKDQYLSNEYPFLDWIQSRIGDFILIASQLVVSMWIMLKDLIFMVLVAIAPFFATSKNESALTQGTWTTNELQTVVRLLQETQNSQGNTLSELEKRLHIEMALIVAKIKATNFPIENSSDGDISIGELETKQTSLLIRLEALSESVRSLSSSAINKDADTLEQRKSLTTLSENVDDINQEVNDLKMKYTELESVMKRCCNKTYVTAKDMQNHVALMTLQIVGDFNASLEETRNWVRTYFVAKEELDTRMRILVKKYLSGADENNDMVLNTLQQTADKILRDSLLKIKTELSAEKLKYQLNLNAADGGGSTSGFDATSLLWNQSKVESIVSEMLKKYDADRTGMFDHALESAGGSIVSTRCTENYQIHHSQLVIMGIGLWKYKSNGPRSVIEPSRNPGDCWAFRGSLGFVVIELTSPVRLTGFTMEHIPKSLSPRGSIDSAPRGFSVYGLHVTTDAGFNLGNYTFRDNGEPLQYFEVQNMNSELFRFVELKIHSNHGNNVYTCVYRFRVHGVRVSQLD